MKWEHANEGDIQHADSDQLLAWLNDVGLPMSVVANGQPDPTDWSTAGPLLEKLRDMYGQPVSFDRKHGGLIEIAVLELDSVNSQRLAIARNAPLAITRAYLIGRLGGIR